MVMVKDAKTYLLACSHIPQGWELVSETTVQHPDRPNTEGALMKNQTTGMYALHISGKFVSIPQGYAKKYDPAAVE